MNDPHQSALKRSLTEMIGVECELSRELSSQLSSDVVKRHDSLHALLTRGAHESEQRTHELKTLLEGEGGSIVAAVEGGLGKVTGTFAGLFAKIHEPPFSAVIRDTLIALNFASIGYAMMLTHGLATGHQGCNLLASRAIKEMPPLIVSLTDLLPLIVGEELARSAPLANPAAVQIAGEMIRDAWRNT